MPNLCELSLYQYGTMYVGICTQYTHHTLYVWRVSTVWRVHYCAHPKTENIRSSYTFRFFLQFNFFFFSKIRFGIKQWAIYIKMSKCFFLIFFSFRWFPSIRLYLNFKRLFRPILMHWSFASSIGPVRFRHACPPPHTQRSVI